MAWRKKTGRLFFRFLFSLGFCIVGLSCSPQLNRASPLTSENSSPQIPKSLVWRARASVTSVAFSPDGTKIAVGERDWSGDDLGYIQIWDAATGHPLALWRAKNSVNSVAFSPDGAKIIAGEENGHIQIWNASNGKNLTDLKSQWGVTSVAFSPDGTRIAAGEWDWSGNNSEYIFSGHIQEWDAMTGKSLFIRGTKNDVNSVAFSPDGSKITTGESKLTAGDIQIWDAMTGENLAHWGTNAFVWSVAFSPDGTKIAAGGFNKSVQLRDATTGKVLAAWKARDLIRSVSFSKDGTKIAGGGDGYAQVWDIATGDELGAWPSKGGIAAIAISPNETEIAAGEAGTPIEAPVGGNVQILPVPNYRYYISIDNAPLKSVTGNILTRLPLAMEVQIKKSFRESDGDWWCWVKIGKNLSGWVGQNNISTKRPDMFAPVIRITEKSLKGAEIKISGVVYADKPVLWVRAADQELKQINSTVKKGNYRYVYSFTGTILATPGASLAVSAEDSFGKESSVPISILDPIIRYTPRYALLEIKKTAPILAEPEPNAKLIAQVPQETRIPSIGYNENFYALEGGGWISRKLAREEAGFIPESNSGANVSIESGSSPDILYQPSEVDSNPPEGVPDPDAIGVIIAEQDYQDKNVPAVQYALNDGRAIKNYFIKTFGISKDNLIDQENATEGQLEAIFGKKNSPHGRLYDYVKTQGPKSRVYVYYVGHGAPDLTNKNPYLVPVDADPDYISLNGYSLKTLYANLNKLPVRSVTVILDACFSGASPAGMIIQKASPLMLQVSNPANLLRSGTIFAASRGSQVANWYPQKSHSLFTYFFLKGLNAHAGLGNAEKSISAGNLEKYVENQVSRLALRNYHRNQDPVLFGSSNKILIRYRR